MLRKTRQTRPSVNIIGLHKYRLIIGKGGDVAGYVYLLPHYMQDFWKSCLRIQKVSRAKRKGNLIATKQPRCWGLDERLKCLTVTSSKSTTGVSRVNPP